MNGAEFGRYRLQSMLGVGAMGEVYRAYDTATRRVVAVKVLPPHLLRDMTFQQRFRREAEIAAGLNDPHVVPIHNFGEINGRLYVDMRLIEGLDLEKILKRGPMSQARAVSIVEQVGSALDTAHRAGLVHRDVKPSNILVTQRDFAYLIDFGIARSMGQAGMTAPNNAIGTMPYMAPECFDRDGMDPRRDVYALACVLHECLTGTRAFTGANTEQLILAIVNSPPPRPSTLSRAVSPAFDAVIARGLAKNPDHRYRSAAELVAAAHAALNAAGGRYFPPPAPPNPPAPVPAPPRPSFWRRHRVGVSAVALTTITAVAVAGLVGYDATMSPRVVDVDIDDVLVRASDLEAILGEDEMVVTARWMHVASWDNPPARVSPESCYEISEVSGADSLVADEFLDMRGERVFAKERVGTEADVATSVVQVVYRLDTSDSAAHLLEQITAEWDECRDRPVEAIYEYGPSEVYDFSGLRAGGDSVSVAFGNDKYNVDCRRTTAVKVNYLVETRVCTNNSGDQSDVISQRILERIPAS